MTATIIISRAPRADEEHHAFEEALIAALAETNAAGILVVPHLYYLSRGHPATERIGKLADERLIVASWLYPRPARWIVRALAPVDDQRITECVDMREFESASACAEHIGRLLDEAPVETASAPQVERIDEPVAERWHPVLDYERCGACRQCVEFCLFHVYGVDDYGEVVVARPENCKPGCPACARLCPKGAIVFPHCETDEAIAGAPGTMIEPGHEAEREAWLKRSGYSTDADAEATGNEEDADELDRLIDALEEMED